MLVSFSSLKKEKVCLIFGKRVWALVSFVVVGFVFFCFPWTVLFKLFC